MLDVVRLLFFCNCLVNCWYSYSCFGWCADCLF